MSINGSAFSAGATYEGITSVVSSGGAVPALAVFNSPALILALIGLILTIILLVAKVKGAILIGIVATTIIGIPLGVVDLSAISLSADSLSASFQDLGVTFGAAFGPEGMQTLFADPSKILMVIMTIFAFSISCLLYTSRCV